MINIQDIMDSTITEVRSHPLEEAFDITPCTTEYEVVELIVPEASQPAEYDDKDMEIERKYEEVYASAMGQYSTLADETEKVEGKYKARVGEVSATMLTIALNAAREKAQLKMHKDKLKPATTGPQTVNNNLIVADRNEILRALAGTRSE